MNQDSVRQYLEEIIETMSEGLFIVGPDGRISMVNESLERLTGFSREELLGKPCTVLGCDACALSIREGRDHWCRLFDTEKESRKHCRIRRKDGSTVEVVKNATLLQDQGEVLASVETLTDVSAILERDRRIDELTRLFGTGFHGMVGNSAPMRRLYAILERAARSDAPVIIHGESGAGKELAAHALHDLGPRAHKPFVQFNCAALNESLLESELFGHVKGAFTGAIRHRQGRFEAADGGDIFLDEIGDVPLNTQVKLLRVLENKRIERVGDHRPVEVDVRVITATNRDLPALVRAGSFREDFYYRINVIPIRVPPIRERAEDIPLLTEFFLEDMARRTGRKICGIEPGAMRLLMAHSWPGNVRELKSSLEYACVITDQGPIAPEHLPPAVAGGNAGACAPEARGEEIGLNNLSRGINESAALPLEPRAALISALRLAGGNKSQAARILGVNRGTVDNRMRKYSVDLDTVIRT
ncbi:sigma-54 interaction domain-containing protein [Desulfocurvus sp. DL9XJH121]